MAKLTTAEFIEAIKELSVLELNELVKACEEEFGVSAAAGVVVAAGPAAEAAEEKTEFDVELKLAHPKRKQSRSRPLWRLREQKLLLSNFDFPLLINTRNRMVPGVFTWFFLDRKCRG